MEAESTRAVLAALGEIGVVPVVSPRTGDEAVRIAQALKAGGMSCLEVALRNDVGLTAISRAREVDGMLVGAGTVLSGEQLRAAVTAGAQYAFSPGCNDEVVEAAAELGVPFFPGVATPTEIERARTRGLRTLKVFPAAQLGGAGFLRAVSATYPDLRFIPTGGVSRDTLAEYLALDSVVACGGSWIAGEAVLDEPPGVIESLAREAVALAVNARFWAHSNGSTSGAEMAR